MTQAAHVGPTLVFLDKERPVSKDIYSFAMVLLWFHNLRPNKLGCSSVQGIYRGGAIYWHCTYHSGRRQYVREATAATNTPGFDGRSLGDP
jgi:hypothetical protein